MVPQHLPQLLPPSSLVVPLRWECLHLGQVLPLMDLLLLPWAALRNPSNTRLSNTDSSHTPQLEDRHLCQQLSRLNLLLGECNNRLLVILLLLLL